MNRFSRPLVPYKTTETCRCGAMITAHASTHASIELQLLEFRQAHRECRHAAASTGDQER